MKLSLTLGPMLAKKKKKIAKKKGKLIFSDDTFCAQIESNYGGKEFLAESLCLHQGMATSARWCHMTLLDHVTPVGG